MSDADLAGRRVVLTRPAGRVDGVRSLLEELGAEVASVPLLAIEPPADGGAALRSALDALGTDGWLALSSAAAVGGLLEAAGGAAGLRRRRLAAVGEATATALREVGVEAEVVSDGSGGTSLALRLGSPSRPGETIVLALASEPRPELAAVLEAAGWDVRTAEAYRTLAVELDELLLERVADADVVVLTSPRGAASLAEQLEGRPRPRAVVALGPTTASGAASAGFAPVFVAAAPGAAAVVAAVVAACGAPGDGA